MREPPDGCTDTYCARCCAYGRHFYGVERLSIDDEQPCSCTCHTCWREGCTERGVARVGWVAGVWCRAHLDCNVVAEQPFARVKNKVTTV